MHKNSLSKKFRDEMVTKRDNGYWSLSYIASVKEGEKKSGEKINLNVHPWERLRSVKSNILTCYDL